MGTNKDSRTSWTLPALPAVILVVALLLGLVAAQTTLAEETACRPASIACQPTSSASPPAMAACPSAAAPAATPDPQAQGAIDNCRRDLAHRLNIDLAQVHLVKVKPGEFFDASLGFPRPGQVYAKMIYTGYRVLLKVKAREYIYAVSGDLVRYGGPVASWECSALYLEPVMFEANLNGNLNQVSLAGTNPQIILRGVSDFYPQADGSVIATRRTSRSGHDLLYLASGQLDTPVRLASAFYFADAVVSPNGSRWLAFSRSGVGGGWEVSLGGLEANSPPPSAIALPVEGRPLRAWWTDANPVISIRVGDKIEFQELILGPDTREWRRIDHYSTPESQQFTLSRSESLVVNQETVDGKPVVKVSTVWFSAVEKPEGNEKLLATISDFTLDTATMAVNADCVLITGKSGEENIARTVDILTGEVLETLSGAKSPIKLLNWPCPDYKSVMLGAEPACDQ